MKKLNHPLVMGSIIMFLKKILLLFLLLGNLNAFSQNNCNIRLLGKVTDDHNQEALSFAKIWVQNSDHNRGTEADKDGFFQLENLCLGDIKIRIEHLDCEPTVFIISVNADTIINFKLEHHNHLLNAIEVTETRSEIPTTQNSQKITGYELLQTRGMNLGESLKKIPGITTLNTGSSISKPMIHGLHSNRVLIMNNGIRQESQQWGNEHAPEIDPFLAGELVVVKGAMGVRYGSDALGGVILVNPKPLPDSGLINGELNLVGNSNGKQGITSGMIDGKINKLLGLQYRIQGTYKKGGNMQTPDYVMDNTGVEERNFSYHFILNKPWFKTELFYSQFNTKIGIFKGAHIGNLTDLNNTLKGINKPLDVPFSYEITRPNQQINHELVKAKTTLNIGHTGDIQLTYGRQYNNRSEFDLVLKSKETIKPELNFEITTHTAEIVFDHHFDIGLIGQAGIFGLYQFNTYEGRYFIPNFKNQNIAGFITERYIKKRYSIEAGIRYDYKKSNVFFYKNNNLQSPEYLFSNLSYNLSGHYTGYKNTEITLAFASAWRAPGINELFSNGVHHGAASFEIGNPNLKTEQGYTTTLGLQFNFNKLKLLNESYYNYFNNFIYLNPTLQPIITIRGSFPTFEFTQAKALITGNDLSATYFILNNLSFTEKISIIYGQNLSNNTPLYYIPSSRLNSGLNFEKELKNIHPFISIESMLVLEQKRYTANTDYAPPPPTYHLLNFEIGTKKIWKCNDVAVIFAVQNCLNVKYRDYTNRFRYFTDEAGINFNLKLNYKF